MFNREDRFLADKRSTHSLRAYIPFALVTLIGIRLSITAASIVRDWDNTRVQTELEYLVDERTKAMNQGISQILNFQNSIRGLFTTSFSVKRDEFSSFVNYGVERPAGIKMLGWIPRVSHIQREGYEIAARQDGMSDFYFTELNTNGEFVKAGRRDEYYPIFFVEPFKGNENALGYDYASNPSRMKDLIQARDTAIEVASERFTSVQGVNKQYEFEVFSPIYRFGVPHDTMAQRRENLLCYSLARFNIGEMVEEILKTITAPSGMDIYFFDDSAEPGKRFLYYHPSRKSEQPNRQLTEKELTTGQHWTRVLNVAGRNWKMVFRPLAATVSSRHDSHSQTVLIAGIIITLMLMAYLLTTIRRNRETLRLVTKISESNEVLEIQIADRKQAEKALAEKSGVLETTFESMTQGISVYDAGLKLVAFNQRYVDLWRFPSGFIRLGMPFEEISRFKAERGDYGPGEVETLVKRGVAAISQAKLLESKFTNPDGTVFVMWRAPMPRGGVINTFTDITEQQAAKIEILKAKEQAELANRTKSEFLANMSHELRTPLNAILGFSELMGNATLGPLGNPKYQEYSKDINDSGRHLLALIEDILDLSKIEAGKLELDEEDIDIAMTIGSCMVLVRERARTGDVKLKTDIPDGLPALHADQRKLKQILVNLLSNAVKFTPAGGEVTLKAWWREDSGYVFQVIDTGIGIALADIPTALSPFGQVDSALSRKYEGTGLGLPLTKSLAEMHGGSLDLQSEEGAGTTVTVRFPPRAHRACVRERSDRQSSGIGPCGIGQLPRVQELA